MGCPELGFNPGTSEVLFSPQSMTLLVMAICGLAYPGDSLLNSILPKFISYYLVVSQDRQSTSALLQAVQSQ
eukprot:9873077-Ditylum_brightwellii.AAC.1